MSTSNVALRVDKELLARIDAGAARDGTTRTEYLVRWLPVYYDDSAFPTALPPHDLEPTGAGTKTVTLRLGDELIERIDHAAKQHGISRTEYILRWQPTSYGTPAHTQAHALAATASNR